MTTLTKKKNYVLPLTRIVLLNAEDTILAASAGERADKAGLFTIYEQRDYVTDLSSGDNTPWKDELTNSPW